jgi:hypothetical protein
MKAKRRFEGTEEREKERERRFERNEGKEAI